MGGKKWRKRVMAAAMAMAVAFTSVPGGMDSAAAAVTGRLRRVSVHDPSIVKDSDGTYYVFGSHIASAKSDDLVNWTQMTRDYDDTVNNRLFGDLSANLKEAFAWAGEKDCDSNSGAGFAVWAPDVFYNKDYVNDDGTKGAYMMYVSTSSTSIRSVIAYAVSDRIDGGYQYKKPLVYSGFTQGDGYDPGSKINKNWTNTNIDELMAEGRIDKGYNREWGDASSYNDAYAPNAIDPTIFTDQDGKMWMTYGSWSGGIYVLEIDPATGDAIYPQSNGKTEDGRVIDKYFGYRIAGGYAKSGEGPYIQYDSETGYYYLYVTYDWLGADGGYNMRLFRAKNPTGPYLDAEGKNAALPGYMDNSDIGIKVMGNHKFSATPDGYRSPGHNSMLIDEDGQRYLFYHTRFQSNDLVHQLRVHQQFINEEGWPVTAVFENRGDQISENGYNSTDIVGTYEFINHGTVSDGASVRSPETVYLKEDGTITGDERGTWKQKDGTCYAEIEVGGVKYSGVFFWQHDEAAPSKEVMTFTAIGANDNRTIMGVRTSSTIQEKTVSGTAATRFGNISAKPVVSYTFDDDSGLELAGSAVVGDGMLQLATNNYTHSETYARIASLQGTDFSKGITITADIVVKHYGSDWTPLFMFGDGRPGGGDTDHLYRFTQGFSSVAGVQHTGYYGNEIASPYSWDYFNNENNRYKWYTVGVTITNSRMATYINGIKVQEGSGAYGAIMSVFGSATNNYLGASYYGVDPDFAGYMDNVAIYNQALSAGDMAKLVGKTVQEDSKPDINKPDTSKPDNDKPDNNKPAKDTVKLPAKGTKLKDKKTGASYKVTKAAKRGGKVTYLSPKNKKVTSVTVPSTVKLGGITYQVTAVADNAWKGCTKLKTIKIGKYVTALGAKACYKCTALTKITIPASVSKIGKQTFYGDKKLKSITVKTTKLKKSSVGSQAFKGIYSKAVIKVPKSKLSTYKKIFKEKGVSGKKQKVKKA